MAKSLTGLVVPAGTLGVLQLRRVRKLPDQRIMPNRLEEAERELIERIDQRGRMPRIEIEWHKLHPQVQLWMVVQLAGTIPLQALGEAPLKKILHRRVIKLPVERHRVVKADVQVIHRAVVHETKGEGRQPAVHAPKEKAGGLRHLPADPREEFRLQAFKAHFRALV